MKEKIDEKNISKEEKKKISIELAETKKFLAEIKKTNKVFQDNLIGKTKSKLKQYKWSRVGTALLYEKIGESEVYDQAYPILRNEDEELGSYIVMQLAINRYVFLDNITSDDWIPSRNNDVKKLIDIVKYADDDYRVRAKVKGKMFYFKRPIYKTEMVEEEVENSDEPLITEQIVYDEDGQPEILEYEEVEYEEPKAVSQSGREAIRIGNAYKIRMQKKRAQNESFFSKYGMHIIFIFFTIMICGTLYMTTKMQVGSINEEWAGIRDERSKGIIDAEVFAKKVVEQQQQIEAHEDAPPK